MPLKILAAVSALFLLYYFYGKIKSNLNGEISAELPDDIKQKVCKEKAILFTVLAASLEVFIIAEYFLTFLKFEHIIAAVALAGLALSFIGILLINKKYNIKNK